MPAEDLDDLVQRLVAAKLALESDQRDSAVRSLEAALATARRLLTEAHDQQLVRRRPAS